MLEDIEARNRLKTLVTEFTESFNRQDIDEVMSFFAEDAVYEEFNGIRNKGVEAIRKALEPQFDGVFGRMQFHTEDILLDTGIGKGMIRWVLTLEEKDRAGGYRGLDLLHFRHEKLIEKHTYCKAQVPFIINKDKMLETNSWPA